MEQIKFQECLSPFSSDPFAFAYPVLTPKDENICINVNETGSFIILRENAN
jgi:hypothetical protein